MPDLASVKDALDRGFRDSFIEHFKALVTNGIESGANPQQRRQTLKERFVHGLDDRLLAYHVALEAITERLGNGGDQLRHQENERRSP